MRRLLIFNQRKRVGSNIMLLSAYIPPSFAGFSGLLQLLIPTVGVATCRSEAQRSGGSAGESGSLEAGDGQAGSQHSSPQSLQLSQARLLEQPEDGPGATKRPLPGPGRPNFEQRDTSQFKA